jgi:hypothetical protein
VHLRRRETTSSVIPRLQPHERRTAKEKSTKISHGTYVAAAGVTKCPENKTVSTGSQFV